jgi:hypothetical protein
MTSQTLAGRGRSQRATPFTGRIVHPGSRASSTALARLSPLRRGRERTPFVP